MIPRGQVCRAVRPLHGPTGIVSGRGKNKGASAFRLAGGSESVTEGEASRPVPHVMIQPVPVFIINLARRPDRLERLGGRLDTLGIAWSRVEALDAKEATDAEIDAVVRQDGPLGVLGRGDRVCTISHMRAWQALLDSGHDYGLVLEDDVYLAEDAKAAVTSTGWIPDGAELVKLEKFGDGPSTVLLGPEAGRLCEGRALHRLLSRHVGGAAYILSRRAAEEGLALAGSIRVPIDHLLFNGNVSALSRRLKPLIVQPAIATQRKYGYNSDIASFGKAIKPKGWRLWRRRAKRGYYEIRLLPGQIVLALSGRARLAPIHWQEEVRASD